MPNTCSTPGDLFRSFSEEFQLPLITDKIILLTMIECPTNHPDLPSLFDPYVPNNPLLWAVFNQRQAGRALVDSLPNPTQCLLRTEARLTYASYLVSQFFLADAIDYFKHIGIVWLNSISKRSAYTRWIPVQPKVGILRLRSAIAHPG